MADASPDKALEKAPYSGAPAAGNPNGVKSGAKLLAQVKAGLADDTPPPVDMAPAEALVRETDADGLTLDTVVARDPKETRTPDADTERALTPWTDTPGKGFEAPGEIEQPAEPQIEAKSSDEDDKPKTRAKK